MTAWSEWRTRDCACTSLRHSAYSEKRVIGMATTRTDERAEFLSDLLITFTESGSALSWFTVDVYGLDDDDRPARVVITDHEGQRHEIDLDTIAKGIGIIRGSDAASVNESLCVSRRQRLAIMDADVANEASMLDCIDASAIVECALFGKVVYA